MIQLEKVSVIYDKEIIALDHVDIKIKEHQCTVIIGKNGSGKSTLLQSLVGLVDITGKIDIDGLVLNKKNLVEIRNKVGLVFQNPDHQLFMSSIYDDLAFGLKNQGLLDQEIDHKIHQIAKELQFEDLLKRSCHKLSGGQKRIIAIATVLVMEPDVILMDEPGSFLDPMSRRRMIDLIKTLDKTLVIASHDLDMALDIADEIVLLNDGKVVYQGDKTILKDQKLLEDNGLELPFCYQR